MNQASSQSGELVPKSRRNLPVVKEKKDRQVVCDKFPFHFDIFYITLISVVNY